MRGDGDHFARALNYPACLKGKGSYTAGGGQIKLFLG